MQYEGTASSSITILIQPEFKKDLDQIAKEEQRSLSNLIKKVLSEYVEAKKARII